jgi:hypothetical protein
MDINNKNEGLLISYLTIRKAIGWLGMLLPFILLILNYCTSTLGIVNNKFFVVTTCNPPFQQQHFFKSSISHYYYTSVGELFTGVLFMFCYKGHPLRTTERGLSDKTLTNLIGLFALGVVLFPTGGTVCIKDSTRLFLASINTGYIHFTMATLFFASLAIMCIVNFRRTEDIVSFGKKKNHTTFLVCGIVMLVCLVLLFVYGVWIQGKYSSLDKLRPIFCLEAIALIFFGISWLVKGQIDFLYIPKKLKILRNTK